MKTGWSKLRVREKQLVIVMMTLFFVVAVCVVYPIVFFGYCVVSAICFIVLAIQDKL